MEKDSAEEETDSFSVWYHKILEDTQIIDMRYPVKGMLVYRGWGMKIIREMSDFLTELLEENGHEPLSMPVLIPENLLFTESEHIAGFEEQVFWVTHAGKNELDEKLALRPTSETPLYEMFKLWIRSHQDLPFRIHHPSAVYRYETKHTRPLIRGREFLWNEGHTAYPSRETLMQNYEDIKRIYTALISDLLCLKFQLNKRPEWDKFPGADATYAFDIIMPDGKTLQCATWHNLGQHFSKVFNLTYEDEKGEHQHPYQSSYAPSFGRLLAALVCVHSDDRGLILPPRIAPIQIVIVPILYKKADDEETLKYAREIEKKLHGFALRTHLDISDERPGARYYFWEMKGVPLRIEVGPRDMKEKKVTVVRRDTLKKEQIAVSELSLKKIDAMLVNIEKTLRERTEKKFKEMQFSAKNLDELKKYLGKGIVTTGWCKDMKCAAEIDKLGASFLSVVEEKTATCVICGKKGKEIRIAKSY